ncbi:MAG: MBL fold metallo-hydrolase [Ignavibacteriaceae bacterium]
MITFLPLGGADEIGANCYYLNINGTGIILDCGMHPKKVELEALPKFELLKDKPLDYVLISHAHQDHLNALPFLVKVFPHIKIVTTPQTRAIAELTLHNTISILGRQIKDESFTIYSHDEVDLLIKTIDYKAYGEEFNITGLKAAIDSDIKAEFFDAGHVLGSAGILINNCDSKIFYTGDINLSSQSLMKGAVLPPIKVNTLILECTYGVTDSSTLNSWEDEVNLLVSSLNKILNSGGSVLIPVFSFGKMQEILAVIFHQTKTGKLTTADIYTGGIGKKINRIYDYNRYAANINEDDLILHDIPQNNIYEINSTEELFKYPSIILASSGMMVENTLSYTLAKRWFSQKDSAIFTVGYMDDETSGYIVANSKKGDKIKLTEAEKEIEVKCEINNFKFSAHSKREELLEIVNRLNPDNVVLVHGDKEAINWVGASIIKFQKGKKVYSAAVGKKISFD